MNPRLFFWFTLIIWILTGCNNKHHEPKQKAIDAAIKSLEFARKDSIDFSSYSISSITRMRDGRQSIVRINEELTGFDKSVHEKLRGKKYWEVCYTVSSDWMTGAIYCYYLHDADLKLITAFRMK